MLSRSKVDRADDSLSRSASLSKSSKIEDRLNKVVEAASSPITKNRSPELIPLTADYEQMKKKIRALIAAVKKYQKKTQEMQESKFELVEQFSVMSERSPVHEEIGGGLDTETAEALKRLRQQSSSSQEQHGAPTTTENVVEVAEKHRKQRGGANDTTISLYGLYSFGAAQAVANDYEYQSHVVDYAIEWEKIVTERVDRELKNVRKLEADRRHYERRVEGLRQRANELESKGKVSPKSQVEKLDRNEEKLKEAFTIHEREAAKLCSLIEAVTHDGYMDLYPLVKNYMKWEINRVGREHDIATQMSATLDSLTEKCGSKKRSKKGSKKGK
mmetsp:Transcript_31904/g.53340  ORF Transcript_31904/g.53340 Transcript_31904/m.53340 type:complete len:330 (+) Transcript_31904:131-1120(+)|eukprot:CAMPEP_0178838276 /NCGR_PEP_ID=MMETSP0746-20121128/13215_1 /TAXON_ID=913974 /ORGANISM="Nitzschia punctata, Strain CCMP561" /LENGTH=329 /DNA_ID=CAMNT_0020501189 /DNA_START=128 /DNA_END=1117 /DNA_ORIENTATION=-